MTIRMVPLERSAMRARWTDAIRSIRSVAELFGPRLDPNRVGDLDLDLVRLVVPLLEGLRCYFRGEVDGLTRMPAGPALLVANHNAGITSIEPFLLGLAYYRHSGGRDFLRFLGHDLMGKIPAVGNALIKLGMVRANHDVASEALSAGYKVMVFPGGNYEAFRPFGQRHRVDFGGHSGFVRLALRTGVPIVPTLCLGGHETLCVLTRGERLARLTGVKRYLRSDAFPLFLGLPWGIGVGPVFHLPLPAKLLVEVGEPMTLREYGPDRADDRALVKSISAAVQARLQEMMDRRAAQRRLPLIG